MLYKCEHRGGFMLDEKEVIVAALTGMSAESGTSTTHCMSIVAMTLLADVTGISATP